MNHALTAAPRSLTARVRKGAGALAATLLVAGLVSGCGSDDEKSTKSSAEAPTTEEFCTAYNSLFDSITAGEQPSDAEAVKALKDWASSLESAGIPEGMPEEAQRGEEIVISTIESLADDATTEDIQAVGSDLSTEEEADSTAFGAYAQKSCTPSPSLPSSPESSAG